MTREELEDEVRQAKAETDAARAAVEELEATGSDDYSPELFEAKNRLHSMQEWEARLVGSLAAQFVQHRIPPRWGVDALRFHG